MNDARRCTATNRAGTRCGRAAILGGHVCNMHGGRAPQVARMANARTQHERAIAAATRLGASVTVDPGEALLGAVHEAAGNVEALRGLVASITLEEAATNPLTKLYADERDRLTRTAKLTLDAGVEERQVRINEKVADRLREALDLAFADIGIDPEKKERFRGAFAKRLREGAVDGY